MKKRAISILICTTALLLCAGCKSTEVTVERDYDVSTMAELDKSIFVDFITVNGIQYKDYLNKYKASNRYVYVEGGQECQIYCIINDPGSIIYKASTATMLWTGTMDAGKRYKLNYKIIRTPFTPINEWKLEWNLVEMK